MNRFFRRLNWASWVLLGLFVVVSTLALRNYWAYAPGSRHRLRTYYDDAYGFPVYVNQLDFWPDAPPLANSDASEVVILGPAGIDSSGVRAGTAIGTWGSGPPSIDSDLL